MDKIGHLQNEYLSYKYILSEKDFKLTKEQKQQATERLKETEVALKILDSEKFSNPPKISGHSISRVTKTGKREIKYNLCYLNSAGEVLQNNPEILKKAQEVKNQGKLSPYQEAHLAAIERFLSAKIEGASNEQLEDLMEDVRITLIPAGYKDMGRGEALNSQQDASSVVRFWLDLFMPEEMEIETKTSGIAGEEIPFEFTSETKTRSSGVIQVTVNPSLTDALEEYFSPGELTDYIYERNPTKNTTKTEMLVKAPDTLFIQVKRSLWDESQGKAVRSDQAVSLPKDGQLTLNSKDREEHTYDITSVICQTGDANVGHYVTYKKVDDEWFLCDNYRSRKVNYEEIPPNQVVMVGLKKTD